MIIIYTFKLTEKEKDVKIDEKERVDANIFERIINKQKSKIEELEKQINYLINDLNQKNESISFNKILYTREQLFAPNFLSSD